MYDRVYPNGEVKFSASRENAVNDLLNQMSATGGIPDRKTYSARQITVPVKLAHAETVDAGELVGFLYSGEDYAQSIAPESWDESGARLGIVRSAMKQDEIADVVALGTANANVTITDVSHGYAEPDEFGKLVSCRKITQFQILTAMENLRSGERQTCSVFIASPAGPEEYRGPFKAALTENETKVEISAGFLNRNGLVVPVPRKIISWGTGYLCIHSEIRNGEWTAPEFKIVSVPSATCYPAAYLSESDGIKRIDQFHVPMAFIILSKPCPAAES